MTSQVVLALLAGLFAGALFGAIRIPIPAPPNLSGVMGIVGIYLGYRAIEWYGASLDLRDAIAGIL